MNRPIRNNSEEVPMELGIAEEGTDEVSDTGQVGGDHPPQPGQISMAHKGVNFWSNSTAELN
jgi:hypothetical protein